MTEYVLAPKAVASLRAIAKKSNDLFGRERTRQYIAALNDQFELLAEFPEKGRERNELKIGIRSCPEGSHMIYYRIKDQHIEIVDVLHQSMDPSIRL